MQRATGEYDAVLFDMDGVTVSSATAWRALEREAILPAAGDGIALEDVRALNATDAYDRLDAMDDVDLHVDREGFLALYDEHAEAVYRERADLMPGYESLLTDIRAADLAVGLVSASDRDWVEMALDRFDLADAYDVVVTATDIDGPSKPDPTPYRAAADRLGVAPERCVVVEDSAHGIEAATAAGAYCIALRGEGNRETDLSPADAVADDPDDLRAMVRDLIE